MTTRYLSYSDAAEYLAIPVGSLRAMVSRKQIPHFRLSARKVTFELADLDAWLAKRRVSL